MRTVTKPPITGTVVTGASDDLIELDGELCEEFGTYHCGDGRMAFSDGTLLTVKYDSDGLWRFKLIFKGSLYDHKIEGCVNDDTDDVVHFKEGLLWAVFSKNMDVVNRTPFSKAASNG